MVIELGQSPTRGSVSATHQRLLEAEHLLPQLCIILHELPVLLEQVGQLLLQARVLCLKLACLLAEGGDLLAAPLPHAPRSLPVGHLPACAE